MNIAEILAAAAAAHPDDAAILDTHRGRTRRTTFAELDRAAARGAALLDRCGLRPGDAVLVFQPMSMELYAALIAVFRLGLVAMFLDPSAGREHIERCCALHAPRALIASTKAHLLRLLSPALRRIPHKLVIGWPVPGATSWARSISLPPQQAIVPCSDETPALLTFTSGSTGQPKAAVRSHGFLLAQHAALADSLQLTRGDVDLTTMPIVLLANLASGVTSLIPNVDLRAPGAIDPEPVLAEVRQHQVVSSVASPAFFERLVQGCTCQRQTLPTFRKLFTGGAPVFPRLLRQMQEMTPQAEVVAVYGSTEAEPIAHIALHEMSADDHRAMFAGKGLLAGKPVPQIQLRIARDCWGKPVGPFTPEEFSRHCLGPQEPGEIVVSGGHVLTGYLHGQGDEETKFRVGEAIWHRTGDAGYLDTDGRVWLLGRCAARIGDQHGTLYPFAGECAVYQEPAVRRAALVRHAGQRILAVELYPHMAAPDLDALRRQLEWAHLDRVSVFPTLPVDKRHNAKIDYPSLYRLLEKT